MKKQFRSFNDAKRFVVKLKLKSVKEWTQYCKTGEKPQDIPTNPNNSYKNEWLSWGDFLGTGNVHQLTYRPFRKAREFVRKLNLSRQKDWEVYCSSGNKPQDIPRNPYRTYKKEWIGMGDWLGTGRIATNNIKYRPYQDARKFVHALNLKNGKEWTMYCKSKEKPQDIPYNVKKVYKKEWIGMGDWLGTGIIASYNMTYWSFKDARIFAQSLNLKNNKEWTKYCRSGNKPEKIPNAPEHQYKNKGWKGWGDFLGTGNIANYNKTYLSFKDARKFVHQLNLKSTHEWTKYCRSGNKPEKIPTAPNGTYKKEWVTWGDFLGTGTVAPHLMKYRSFKEARKFVRKLKIKNTEEWYEYCRSGNKPDDIPTAPWNTYKEWKKK